MSGIKTTFRDPRVRRQVSRPDAVPDEQVLATIRRASFHPGSAPQRLSISRQRSAYPTALKWGISDLHGVELFDSDLAGSHVAPRLFQRAVQLQRCRFTKVDLQQSRFKKVEIRDCTFDRVAFRDSRFGSVLLADVTVTSSDLRYVSFDSGTIRSTVFDRCQALRTGIRMSEIVDTRFAGRFEHVFFVDSTLASVDFSDAAPGDLVFSRSILRNVRFPVDREWVAVLPSDLTSAVRGVLPGASAKSRSYLEVLAGEDPDEEIKPWIVGRGVLGPLTTSERDALMAALRPHAIQRFDSPNTK